MLKHVTVVKSSFFSHDKCHCPSLFSTIRVGERKHGEKKGVEKRHIYIYISRLYEWEKLQVSLDFEAEDVEVTRRGIYAKIQLMMGADIVDIMYQSWVWNPWKDM